MKRLFSLILLAHFQCGAFAGDTLSLCSPSGNLCAKFWLDKNLKYKLHFKNKLILAASEIDMRLADGRNFSVNNKIKSARRKQVSEKIISPVPEKRKIINNRYSELAITFKQPYIIEIRAFDDGLAYRFVTAFKDSITVRQEAAVFNFPTSPRGEAPSAYFPAVHKRSDADIFHTSFEELYPLRRLDKIDTSEMAYLPVLVQNGANPKIAILESDLEDYAGMFLKGTQASSFKGIFANYPLEEKLTNGSYPQMLVTKRADYIAKTNGSRTFPWRILAVAEEDKDLPSNDIVYRLASPSRIGDASWINPGKGTDEWIIGSNIYHVPFKSGINTNTYKYYIDFAKKFGFQRIMMDAGWSDNLDLFKINPEINMDSILTYAREKGIKVSMWTLSHTLERQLEPALQRFNQWGVDYIMTDFIDRDDQKTINFYFKIAKACAAHKIMLMFHGAYPQKGFNRTYPNNVAREGVLGSEYNMWSDKATPPHDVTLPFTRMLAGSFDYEPVVFNNAEKKGFKISEGSGMVMTQGTRSHQLAMYVVYDNPMQIFAGNPSQALLEPEFTQLMGEIPTTWDETKILDGKAGEFIVTARQKGNAYYIAGMTNWTARDIAVKFDFIDNKNYKATICKDGVNAEKYAGDYAISVQSMKQNDVLKLHLAEGGGFYMKLE